MKKIIKTKKAPEAIGPYSQGIVFGGVLYTSGQIPLKPDGTLVQGDFREEVKQCLENIQGICEAAGTDLSQALKICVFLSDMEHFSLMNEVYAAYFKEAAPARSCVAVKTLPKNVRVEIEGIFAVL
jgi:2-iminobutanoate/2-iminopropanoate deaminase